MNLFVAQSLKDVLKPELDQLDRTLRSLAAQDDGFLGELKAYVITESGKRIRPALVMLASKLGNASPERVQTVSLAVELIHIATLVHDDVIDKATLRRNRKTVAAEFGIDVAVLLGDHIFTYAFEQAAMLNEPLISQLLARAASVMCAGEIGQLRKRFQFDLTEKDYFSFLERKTASLFAVSARCGAVLAQQSVEVQLALEKFSTHLGLAFQITDDILDLAGDESVVGKTLRTDLLNGKMTLPLIYFRDQLSTEADKKSFLSELQSPNGHLSDLVDRIKSSRAFADAEKMVASHTRQAVETLAALPSGPAKELFLSLVDSLQQRKA
jgi:geranylgeranyl pyrophosphate synthase